MRRIEGAPEVYVGELMGNNISQRVLPTPEFQQEIAESRTEEKRQILKQYFTNIDGNVRAIRGTMPSVVAAALVARFSRADEPDVTELFWREFVTNPDLGSTLVKSHLHEGGVEEGLASDKARKMIKRILDKFGDDSVREDASGYVTVQNASVLSAFEIFQHPLITGIEASTRYIDWTKKDANGRYRYDLPPNMNSEQTEIFARAADNLFDTYSKLWQPVWNYIAEQNPKPEGMSEEVYKTAVKGRVCDNLRKLLPLGIQTTFGIHANYRTLSEVIMNSQASELLETRHLGQQIGEELYKVNPEFIAVALGDRGEEWTNHRIKTKEAIAHFGNMQFDTPVNTWPGVRVDVKNADYLFDIVKGFLAQEHPGAWEESINSAARQMIESGTYKEFFKQIGNERTNRRHKFPDALNNVLVTMRYENGSFSVYKDLNRHRRIESKTPPDFTAQRGYYVPLEIMDMGGEVVNLYCEAQKEALAAYHALLPQLGVEARRILTHGTKTVFEITMGLEEAMWVHELRSIASGDVEYRHFAQEAHRQILRQMPELELMKNFVNFENHPLGRIGEAVRADLRGTRG